jgi:hypothetical protein
MFDAIRRALFQRRRPSQVTSTPDTDVAEQFPLRPAFDIVPPSSPPVARPRLAIPPIIEKGASIPPQVGERAYYNDASDGCMAWEINGNKSLCHFSAPSSFYPGPGATFIGVVERVDGVCHHVLPPSGFSVKDTR